MTFEDLKKYILVCVWKDFQNIRSYIIESKCKDPEILKLYMEATKELLDFENWVEEQ